MPRQKEHIRVKEGDGGEGGFCMPSCLISQSEYACNHLSSRKQHADVYPNWEIGGFRTVHTLPDGDLIVNSRLRTATDGISSPLHDLIGHSGGGTGGVRADDREARPPWCH